MFKYKPFKIIKWGLMPYSAAIKPITFSEKSRFCLVFKEKYCYKFKIINRVFKEPDHGGS